MQNVSSLVAMLGLGVLLSARMHLFAHLAGPAWSFLPIGAAACGWAVGRALLWTRGGGDPGLRLVFAGLAAACGVAFAAAPRLDQLPGVALGIAGTAAPFALAAALSPVFRNALAAAAGFLAAPWLLDRIGGPPATDGLAGVLLVAAGLILGGGAVPLRAAAAVLTVAFAGAGVAWSPHRVAPGTADALRELGAPPGELVERRWTSRGLEERVAFGAADAWRFRGGDAPVPEPGTTGGDAVLALAARDPLIAMILPLSTGSRVLTFGAFPSAGEPTPGDASGDPADLIVVASTQMHGSDRNDALYSRDAFDAAWRSVAPGGLLAWLAADEAVFLRGLLTIAEVADAEIPVARHAWGFGAEVANATPYRFLALLPKRDPHPDDAPRLARAGGARSVEILFGPPFAGRGMYASLADSGGVDAARDLLRRELSGRSRRWVNLDAATRARPSFAWTDHHAPPPWRAVTAAGVLGLLACLILPSAARRRVDAPDARRALPWPLRMAAPSLLAAGSILVVFTMTHAEPVLARWCGSAAGAAVAGLAAGVLALRFARPDVRTFVVEVPDLAPWVLCAAGSAALAAGALAPWIALEHGGRTTGVAGLALWIAGAWLAQAFARR